MEHFERNKNIVLFAAALFALSCNAVLFSGCTLLGVGTGLVVDYRPPREIKSSAVDTVTPGTRMVIVLADHERMVGRFVGTDCTFPPHYVEAYDSARRLIGTMQLPAFGDSVKVFDVSGTEYSGEFTGFSRSQFSLPSFGLDDPLPFVFFKERSPTGSALQTVVAVRLIENMNGNKIDRQRISALLEDHAFPTPAKWITIAGDQTIGHVSFQDVTDFRIDEADVKSHNGWWIGGMIGVVFDAVIFLIIIPYAMEHP